MCLKACYKCFHRGSQKITGNERQIKQGCFSGTYSILKRHESWLPQNNKGKAIFWFCIYKPCSETLNNNLAVIFHFMVFV